MQELKQIIARNIIELRRANQMTQLELAETLNYTDKAVSKWERGESLPDIGVLKAIADLFGVKLDYLVTKDHVETVSEILLSPDGMDEIERKRRRRANNRRVITCISILLVWLVATLAFVVARLCDPAGINYWLAFIYAVPVMFIVWLVLNSVWFSSRRNFLIISLLMWSVLASIHITCAAVGADNVWLIYVLGVPGQAIILLWSRLLHRSK